MRTIHGTGGRNRRQRRAPLRRRWLQVALLAVCGALAAAAPTLWAWSSLRDAPVLIGLGGLMVCSAVSDISFGSRAQLVADDAIVTLLLVIGGPLAALAGLLGQDLFARLVLKRLPVRSATAICCYVSYAAAAAAGAATLHVAGIDALSLRGVPTLLAAALTWQLVNWTIASLLPGVLVHRRSMPDMWVGEFRPALPAQLGLALCAGVVLALLPLLGTAVLIVIAPTVLIPRFALPLLARSRDITRLPVQDATVLYGEVLCRRLALPRHDRHIASDAALLLQAVEGHTVASTAASWTALGADEQRARIAWGVVREISERWDGTDLPGGYHRGALLSPAGRILAVARRWAQLTAAGGPQLTQRDAALALELDTTGQFDPWVVRAATEVIEVESRFATLETFEPTLDRLPLPPLVRTGVLPWALTHA